MNIVIVRDYEFSLHHTNKYSRNDKFT